MVNGVLLLFTVLLPVVVSVLGVALFVGEGAWSGARIKSILRLDTSKGLVHQGLLWLAVITPVVIAVSLGGWVWVAYEFELSSAGFKKFIDISILPLAVMSLSLPLSGLISRFHSTQQTAKQIEVVSFKNNLDAFYTHRKELIAYFAAMKPIDYLGVMEFEYFLHPVLHVRFFTGAPESGWPEVNVESFDKIGGEIIFGAKFLRSVIEPQSSNSLTPLDCYLNACLSIYHAADLLHICEVTRVLLSEGVAIKSDSASDVGFDLLTIGTTTLQVLAAIRFTKGFYDNLCDFAGVPRLVVPEGLDVVFHGGRKMLETELVIERLHETDIAALVACGRAEYGENHPVYAECCVPNK